MPDAIMDNPQRKRDRTRGKKHSSLPNTIMDSSRTNQPKDTDKGKKMMKPLIKKEEVEGMDERVAWKEVSSCRWSLVREHANNKRKPVANSDPSRLFNTMSEYQALLLESSTEDIHIKKELDGNEYRNPLGLSNIDMEDFSTDRPKNLDQGDSLSEMVIKEEEIDEGGLAELLIETPAIKRKRDRSCRGDSTKSVEAKEEENRGVSMRLALLEKKRRTARIQDETEAASEDKQVIARRVSSPVNFTFIDRINPVTETSLLQITPFSPAEVLASLKISRQVKNVLGVQVRRIFRARREPMRLKLRSPGTKRIRKIDDGNKKLAQVHVKKEEQSEEEGPEEPNIEEEELSDEDKSEIPYKKEEDTSDEEESSEDGM